MKRSKYEGASLAQIKAEALCCFTLTVATSLKGYNQYFTLTMDHRRPLDCERGLPVVMNPQKNSAVPNGFAAFHRNFQLAALKVDGFSLAALVALLHTAGDVLSENARKTRRFASCPLLNDEINRQG